MSFRPSIGERLLGTSRLVFDAGSLLLYFADDGRATEMLDEVVSGSVEGYTCDPVMAELYALADCHAVDEALGYYVSFVAYGPEVGAAIS